jgi:hypothetical protein
MYKLSKSTPVIGLHYPMVKAQFLSSSKIRFIIHMQLSEILAERIRRKTWRECRSSDRRRYWNRQDENEALGQAR